MSLKIILYTLPFLFFLYHILVYFHTRVPIVNTPRKYFDQLFYNLKIPKNSTIYELGCGAQANFLFRAQNYKPCKLVGYELSILHACFARFKAKLKKKSQKTPIEIYCQDFWKVSLSDADIVYAFLVPEIVQKVWEKLKKEAKPGTILISLADQIPGEKIWQQIPTRPNDTKTTYYYIYRV